MAKDLFNSALLDVYGEFLNEKQRRVMSAYYYDDLSLSEIAENEGITRQGVCDLIKRSETQLHRLEESCGYCKKFSDMRLLASALRCGESGRLEELLRIIDNL